MKTATISPIEARNAGTPALELELDEQGRIRTCTRAAAHLFGYSDATELLGRSILHLFPQLDHAPLMHQGKVSGRLKMLSRCGVSFRARRCNGEYFDADLYINELDSDGDKRIVMIVQPRSD